MARAAFDVLDKKDSERYSYFLWLKFIICNLLFITLFTLGIFEGWVDKLFGKKADVSWLKTLLTFDALTTYILVMTLVFAFGLFISIKKVFVTSREINYLKEENPPRFSRVAEYLNAIRGADSGTRANLHHILEDKWFSRLAIIGRLSAVLVLLGFLGTVVGFVMVLSGINPGLVGDTNSIGTMVATLVNGMGVALYTTLAGGIFGGIWLETNLHILRVGGSDFVNLLGEFGEIQEKTRRELEE